MQIRYNAFFPLTFSGQFYEKWVSVRERNIKLLLDTVTYIATAETVTCIITKYHLHDGNRDSHVHNFNKNCRHIFAAETFTCINAAKTSNCIIATETVTHA